MVARARKTDLGVFPHLLKGVRPQLFETSISQLFLQVHGLAIEGSHTPMLLMVFPSSSVLTAARASVDSHKADKDALNHIVQNVWTARIEQI